MKDKERANSSSYNITAIAESRPDSTQAKVYINYDNDIRTDAVMDHPNDTTKPECHHQNINAIPQKDLISNSAKNAQPNPSEQSETPSGKDFFDIVKGMASLTFTLGIVTGFCILFEYAVQIGHKDLILEMLDAPSAFILVAILPFLILFMAVCVQMLAMV